MKKQFAHNGKILAWSEEKILLIGCGNMGRALLKGWLANGIPPDNIYIVDPSVGQGVISMGAMAENVFTKIPSALKIDIIILAVKPQLVKEVASSLTSVVTQESVIISVAAGVALKALSDVLPSVSAYIRAMPNLPAAVGQASTALCATETVSLVVKDLAYLLFSCVGSVHWVKEEHMHLVTGVAGSGAAYVFLMIEAMAEAAISEGLPEILARRLAVETVSGAGSMALMSDYQPSELRERVSSPKGTTVAGLIPLLDDEKGLFPLMLDAIVSAANRSKSLSESS